MTLYYPAQLDTVRFVETERPEVRAQRALRATGDIMLELVAGRRLPVFSAGQIFDGAVILDLVRSNDPNSTAFLDLVAESRIHMRILPGLVNERETEAETFTVTNAFVSALERNFVFSAWPELSDREARDDVAAVLRDGSRNSFSPALAGRLEALQRLDLAFRQSETSEKATECDWDLSMMVADRLENHNSLTYLRRHHSAALAMNGSRETPYDLRTRSGWYDLLDAYLAKLGWRPEHGPVRSLRRTIDTEYNRKIAYSLGAAVSREDEDDKDLRSVLEDPAMYRYRREASLLLGSDARDRWFSWADLHARLGPARYRIGNEGPTTRDARIKELVQDGYLAQIDQSRFMLFVRRATQGLSSMASTGPGSIAGTAVGASVGGGVGSVVTGALFGALVGGSLSGLIDQTAINNAVQDWSLERHLKDIQEATTADTDVEPDPNGYQEDPDA